MCDMRTPRDKVQRNWKDRSSPQMKSKNKTDEGDEMVVFGYSCKLFPTDGSSASEESRYHLQFKRLFFTPVTRVIGSRLKTITRVVQLLAEENCIRLYPRGCEYHTTVDFILQHSRMINLAMRSSLGIMRKLSAMRSDIATCILISKWKKIVDAHA
ncbi:hypothetical protein QR680_001959 [Steinernema hermaphroditum]|uniref:Uncharacterized protein n=1 Tax=Steinernema hermaphroditum TaxID=289476 RepID=A0AA39H0N3_9BILA|nr:hypothetical protein QR680_001959 [Steinernema hermaphroditum]